MVKEGQVRLVFKEPPTGLPNGVALSADERYLYTGAGPSLFRHEIQPDGTLTNEQVVAVMKGGFIDGVKVDSQGNIYSTGPGGVWVVNPEGRHLGTIRFNRVANLGFGGDDGKTIFFTAGRDLYRMPVKVAGPIPGPPGR